MTTPPWPVDLYRRYSRQLILPELGRTGQQRLRQTAVLCVGLGGLGCPAATYLAAAGIGRLGLVDHDTVDLSNLPRQTLYDSLQVGRPKVPTAAQRLRALNPDVQVIEHDTLLTAENAVELVGQYDLVIDGSDNFSTRYVVNDACLLAGKPDIHASVYRFQGRASVFCMPGGPCYRCLFPSPPAPQAVPACAEGGVLGVVAGLMGLVQANEAIKLAAGIGQPLVGRLLQFDALAMQWHQIAITAHPRCPACSPQARLSAPQDLPGLCAVEQDDLADDDPAVSLQPDELHQMLQAQPDRIALIDVRQPVEYDLVHLPGACLIPLSQMPGRLEQVRRLADQGRRHLVLYCHNGRRSRQAVELLRQAGFTQARHLAGGIDRWAEKIDPSMPRY